MLKVQEASALCGLTGSCERRRTPAQRRLQCRISRGRTARDLRVGSGGCVFNGGAHPLCRCESPARQPLLCEMKFESPRHLGGLLRPFFVALFGAGRSRRRSGSNPAG